MSAEVKNLHTLISSVLSHEKKSSTREPRKGSDPTGSKKFVAMPHAAMEGNSLPAWQVSLEILRTDTPVELCLEINGDITLGVEDGSNEVINLLDYNKNIQGVSRRHIKLSPTETDLLMIDLNSTNGTRKNGRLVQPNTPYSIFNGDILELGDLLLAINIETSPRDQQVRTKDSARVVNAFAHLSTAITSNLNMDEVLDRIVEIAVGLCQAGEIALFLWDEQAQELYLKAARGVGNKTPLGMKIPKDKASPVNRVFQTGESLRSSVIDGFQYEVAEGYIVDAALYAPVMIGETSVGVLIAMQRNKERDFTHEDERTLGTVAKFAAIAIQNSQKYEATNQKLQGKLDELSTYNSISKALSKTNNLTEIYNVLRNQARERWKVENIGLWLIDETTNSLVPFPKPSFHKTYSIGEEMIGSVASCAEPILATDIKLFSGQTKTLEATLQLLARSAACVPIIENNKVLGVLGAFSIHENEFHEEDIHVLQMMSQAASAAIRNAWLFEQIDKQRATILAAVNMLPQPMMIVDQDGKIIVSNKAADAMLNEIHSALNGEQGTHRSSLMSLTTLMSDLAESKWHTKELIVGDKIYVATLEYASMVGTVILMQDVTDPVTGTSNQRHFQDLAQQAFEQAKRYKKPLSVLAIGQDDLKRVIHDQGYVIGNQILKGLASELRSFLRTPDILGRYQDNEFVVLLPETTLEHAQVVAERIIKSMAKKSIAIENHKIVFKLSIGTATLDFDTDKSIDSLIRTAFEAYPLSKNDHKRPIKVHNNL